MPDIVDAMNHGVDSLRYSLAPLIRQGATGFLHYMAQQVAEGRARKAAEPEAEREIAPGVQLGGAMTCEEVIAYKRLHGTPLVGS